MARKTDAEDMEKDEEKYELQDAADLEDQANPRNYEDDREGENIAPVVVLQRPKHSMLAQLEDVGLYGKKTLKGLEKTRISKAVKAKPVVKLKKPLKKKKKK